MPYEFPTYVRISAFETSKEDYLKVLNSDGSITYTIEAKFIHLLSSILQFNYSVIHPTEKNGTRTGIISMVENLDADISVSLLGITEETIKAVDFSYPYYITDITFLTNPPQPLAKSLAIFYPFSYQLWITLAAFFVGMSVLFFIVLPGRKQFSGTLLTVLGSVTGQSLSFRISKPNGRFLLVTWLWGIMLIKLSYEGTLLSFLSFPPMEGVRNTAQLAKAVEKGSHICMTFKGSYIVKEFLENDSKDYKIIGKSLLENSVSKMRADVAIRSSPKKVAFYTIRRVLSVLQRRYFLSQDSFSVIMIGAAMPKNFCCRNTLNKVIRRIVEAGLYEKILKDQDEFGFIKISTEIDELSAENRHVLNLDDVTGAFTILIIGYALALIVFVLEILYWKKMHNCRS